METSKAAPAVQAEDRSTDGGEGSPRPGSLTPVLYGMRRSCDACGRKKRKCEGERPSCRRCLRAGEECVYSKRMCHLPEYQQQQHSTSGAVVRHDGMLPLKRCSLSPSPATGLVGMQENAFLSDFFACVGFLPITTKSDIRETMVRIMLAPASKRQAALGVGGGGAGQAPGGALAIGGEFGDAFGGKELPMNPSTCMFWCAVALGALVKGSPVESVASYAQLAADALEKSHSGPANAEVALAWTVLAFLHNFTGNSAKFLEYLTRSDGYLIACVERGSTDMLPVGFAEKVQRRDSNPHHCDATAYSFFSQVPQLNTGAGEHELFRYMMQSFRDFEIAAVAKLLENSSPTDPESPGGAEATPAASEGDGDQADQSGTPQLNVISDALASAWTQGGVAEFDNMEEELDRSGIGGSMAGILINGFLAYKAAGRGDVPSALERLARGIEVFERYPGLCRSVMGAHEAHELFAALGALDDARAGDMFNTLRDLYNPCRPRGTSPVPPLEEWQGMSSICGSRYCSAIGGVIASDKMRAFSRPAGGGVDANDIGGRQGDVGNRSFAGEFAASPETLLMMPSDELVQGAWDHDLSSADWLDVTHAMLDADNEPDQAGSR